MVGQLLFFQRSGNFCSQIHRDVFKGAFQKDGAYSDGGPGVSVTWFGSQISVELVPLKYASSAEISSSQVLLRKIGHILYSESARFLTGSFS